MDDWEYEDCPACGELAKRFQCSDCGGEGYRELYDEDPLWYDPDETETCEICNGTGTYWICPHCSITAPTDSPAPAPARPGGEA